MRTPFQAGGLSRGRARRSTSSVQVLLWVGEQRNRVISLPESLAYGRRVLDALSLTVDGRAVSLELGNVEAPSVADIDAGTGTLRLRASAMVPSVRTGRHELTLINSHQPETSVYLANALVPSDTSIRFSTSGEPSISTASRWPMT